jgi:hypothetical protein
MYLEPIQKCAIFKSCKRKFLNAVMATCRTEMFMPNVSKCLSPLHIWTATAEIGKFLADLEVMFKAL